MNDRFKVRGMTLGGKWVYGNLAVINKKIKPYRITIDEGYYISNTVGMPFAYPVRPETIGQCTGLKDKNGNLIYESDYVKANDVIYRVFWNKTKISLANILNGDIIDMSETITMEIVGNEHEKDNISEIPKNTERRFN